jgi:serine/threonine protein phosphatase PrpC
MPFEWRVFELAKEPEHPDQNQDAWWLNAQDGVAAIADGVTSGIFSRQWARILTRAAVEDWPNPSDEERFPAWLVELRRQWEAEIDTSGLAWYQRAKLREGGFSTLVWLRLLDNDGLRDGRDQSSVEVMAIGDSCLFHVRDNEMLEAFPLETAREFDSSPLVLGSVDLNRDDQLQFERLEISCRAGDLLVLCTDAVAAWALQRREQGEPVPWSDYWDMSPEAWAAEVCELRMHSKMRYDDATIVLLRVGQAIGGSAEDYSTPAIKLPESVTLQDDSEVDLLAVDWQEPTNSTDTPTLESDDVATKWIAADEPTHVEPEASPEPEVYTGPDTYSLQTPPPDAAPSVEPDLPPPLPTGAAPDSAPPPPPPPNAQTPASEEDWRDQVNTFSERLFKKLSDGLAHGVDKLQEAKDSAVKKLREKTEGTSPDDDSQGRDP